ncbi:DNA-processing protein DprA [Bifidobacterium oedipodis]|uniref:DNA processing protein DprA n=1 Tax=Bifidobacterium oedipodis TaxID=2675322 RepID=A0A7Y0HR86_9BIFI|nr:DNA-processing protein DprA [Bifidobacterium sp. DSM 109957]NMM93750.1 DNA processing protein DprA [Bifidobacterium sp. DSM 109957]
MNHDALVRENSALVALLKTCEKPETWTSIANDCVLEGSAERLLRHKIDPSRNPLLRDDVDGDDAQGVLLSDVGLSSEQIKRLETAWTEATRDLEMWRERGLDFVSVLDPRFPERLRATIDVPPFLFASGNLRANDLGVSIVGSRHCTPEGARFAVNCAHMLVERRLTVIAGLAKGIDTFAHQTALNDGGRTVAFIGTGIDRQYPAENRGLQCEIEERGLVLSQFWPGSQPTRQSFPMRNALMSGYGVATIIADAGEHSGTRIQARQAQRHGRPIIINRMVLNKAQWARDLEGMPGVYVVDNVNEVERALDRIFFVNDNVDSLIEAVLAEEPVKV